MKEQTEKPEDGETQERDERENGWMKKHRSWRMDEIKAEPEDEETLEGRRRAREMDDEVPKQTNRKAHIFIRSVTPRTSK
jgi:hypothetical protein